MKISNVFPELNSEWLLTGNGNMLKNTFVDYESRLDHNPPVKIPPLFPDVKLNNKTCNSNEFLILKLDKEIRFFKTIITTLKGQIKEKEELIKVIKNGFSD